MDHQTLEAAFDNNSLRGDGVLHTNGHHAGSETRMKGSVTVFLERHDPVPLSRPWLQVKPSEYTWSDENGHQALRHSFRDALRNHHLWKDDDTRTPWTVDFDAGEIAASEVRCLDDRHLPHHKSMLSYVFSVADDYKRFQTVFRGMRFINDHEIASINCKGHDTYKEKRQDIKSWESNAMVFLTIPVSLRSPGSSPPWKIKHVEVMASWMTWEKVKSKAVKAELKKDYDEDSLDKERAPPIRRTSSSLLRAFHISKGHRFSVSSPHDDTRTIPSSAQQWPRFFIEFSSTTGQFNFYFH